MMPTPASHFPEPSSCPAACSTSRGSPPSFLYAGPTAGRASPACISCSDALELLAERAGGVQVPAKSSALKPRRRETSMASASPSANITVVDAVGARFSAHASSVTQQSRNTSLAWASVDSGLPQKAIRASPRPLHHRQQFWETLVGLAARRRARGRRRLC